ncbi:MAG TPA: hypothetical protein VHB49_01755 [Bradyrhizobium sp.]|nr:hypothetical protein [Bradyrhizobium sp.]
MPLRPNNIVRPLIAVAVIAVFSSCAFAQRPPTPSRIRGTVESLDGNVLMVKSHSGEDVKLHMNDATKVLGVTKVSLADVKVGSFIGTTTRPGPDGKPKAVEVHVFPENMRGTGEGSRPWDLGANSSMTNATVAESVSANDGRTLTVKYKGGEKQVEISPDTPVVTFVPGDKSELKAGAKVIAFVKAEPDGSFDTNRVGVGLDGLTPPM